MNNVFDLQKRLRENGIDCGPIDGIWGPKTLDATCEGIRQGFVNADADLNFLKFILNARRPTRKNIDRYAGALLLTIGEGGVKASNKADFAKKHLTTVSIPWADGKVHKVTVNKIMEAPLRLAFAEIEYWNRVEPHKAWLPKVFGSWCIRIQSSDEHKRIPSTHSWAIAFDVDPSDNMANTNGNLPDWIVEVFEGWGFFWGGRWKKYIDPMHFQFMSVK